MDRDVRLGRRKHCAAELPTGANMNQHWSDCVPETTADRVAMQKRWQWLARSRRSNVTAHLDSTDHGRIPCDVVSTMGCANRNDGSIDSRDASTVAPSQAAATTSDTNLPKVRPTLRQYRGGLVDARAVVQTQQYGIHQIQAHRPASWPLVTSISVCFLYLLVRM